LFLKREDIERKTVQAAKKLLTSIKEKGATWKEKKRLVSED